MQRLVHIITLFVLKFLGTFIEVLKLFLTVFLLSNELIFIFLIKFLTKRNSFNFTN